MAPQLVVPWLLGAVAGGEKHPTLLASRLTDERDAAVRGGWVKCPHGQG